MTAHVLVVEDSAVQAEVLRDDLTDAGYHVEVAENGVDALAKLARRRADVIITDVMMPGMGGYELCRRVKDDRELAHIPVVLLTSLRDPVDIVRGLESGADNFLTKPYELDQLLHRLETVLRTHDLRSTGRFRMGVEVLLLGHTFTVSAERQQILDMLMSSFEELVNTNDRLREREEELEHTQHELTAHMTLSDRRQRQLGESRAQLRHTLEATGVATWTLSVPDGRLTWSENAASILGLGPDARIGTIDGYLDTILEEDRDTIAELATRLLRDPGSVGYDEYELRIRGDDGEVRSFSARPAGTGARTDGGATTISGVVVDVTRRRELETALEHARDEAERANQAKSEYLSRMSHELRTPLNSVLGFAQLLELSDLQPDDRDSVDRILAAGRHLLTLIDDVLDIARIEAGKLTVSLEPVPVDELVTAATELIRTQATDRDVSITVSTGRCDDDVVIADRQRLSQVLINLLSNAVKYNVHGGSVTTSCAAAEPGWHRIWVSDTGEGIPVEERSRLFAPFDRLGADRTDVPGTGLGLALSQTLVEAMNGRIGVEGNPDGGSTFWIELPVAEHPADTARSPVGSHPASSAIPGTDPVTLLYVDDDPLNVTLVRRALEARPGTTVLHAPSGHEGLAMIDRSRPDLVLLDLHLPDATGREVLRRLRGDVRTESLPVVILSAEATTSHTELLDAGADGYLTEPLDLAQLRHTVDELLAGDE